MSIDFWNTRNMVVGPSSSYLISVVWFKQGQIKTGAPCRSERLAKYNQVNFIAFGPILRG